MQNADNRVFPSGNGGSSFEKRKREGDDSSPVKKQVQPVYLQEPLNKFAQIVLNFLQEGLAKAEEGFISWMFHQVGDRVYRLYDESCGVKWLYSVNFTGGALPPCVEIEEIFFKQMLGSLNFRNMQKLGFLRDFTFTDQQNAAIKGLMLGILLTNEAIKRQLKSPSFFLSHEKVIKPTLVPSVRKQNKFECSVDPAFKNSVPSAQPKVFATQLQSTGSPSSAQRSHNGVVRLTNTALPGCHTNYSYSDNHLGDSVSSMSDDLRDNCLYGTVGPVVPLSDGNENRFEAVSFSSSSAPQVHALGNSGPKTLHTDVPDFSGLSFSSVPIPPPPTLPAVPFRLSSSLGYGTPYGGVFSPGGHLISSALEIDTLSPAMPFANVQSAELSVKYRAGAVVDVALKGLLSSFAQELTQHSVPSAITLENFMEAFENQGVHVGESFKDRLKQAVIESHHSPL